MDEDGDVFEVRGREESWKWLDEGWKNFQVRREEEEFQVRGERRKVDGKLM